MGDFFRYATSCSGVLRRHARRRESPERPQRASDRSARAIAARERSLRARFIASAPSVTDWASLSIEGCALLMLSLPVDTY
jgi:hypothetical protein